MTKLDIVYEVRLGTDKDWTEAARLPIASWDETQPFHPDASTLAMWAGAFGMAQSIQRWLCPWSSQFITEAGPGAGLRGFSQRVRPDWAIS